MNTLNQRKRRILRAITDEYIETAEPVGSRAVARRYDLGVSPATIRNEMADLEDSGYLFQPHTSAGRVPSDKGYRFYVDELMDRLEIGEEERHRVLQQLSAYAKEVERAVHATAELLAVLTNYVSVAVAPAMGESRFKHLQMIPVDDETLLIVLVTDPGYVQNRIVSRRNPLTLREAGRLSLAINERLRGRLLGSIGRTDVDALKDLVSDSQLLNEVVSMLVEAARRTDPERIYLDGTVNMLNQPEFRDVERTKVVLGFLEDRKSLLRVVEDAVGKQTTGVSVRIGQENKQVEVQDCSFVMATYGTTGGTVGAVGVVGPTRMEYARVTAAVEFMANVLSEILNEEL